MKSKLNQSFIIDLQGTSFVTYEGLLDLAHQKGLISMEVELIQIPNKNNGMIAICKATAKTKDDVYTDIGDAAPNSVNRSLIPHLIRMASTRAKARALRDLTNIGITAIEEVSLEEGNQTIEKEPPTNRQLDTLKELSKQLNYDIPYDTLDKLSAGSLISNLLEQIKNSETKK